MRNFTLWSSSRNLEHVWGRLSKKCVKSAVHYSSTKNLKTATFEFFTRKELLKPPMSKLCFAFFPIVCTKHSRIVSGTMERQQPQQAPWFSVSKMARRPAANTLSCWLTKVRLNYTHSNAVQCCVILLCLYWRTTTKKADFIQCQLCVRRLILP